MKDTSRNVTDYVPRLAFHFENNISRFCFGLVNLRRLWPSEGSKRFWNILFALRGQGQLKLSEMFSLGLLEKLISFLQALLINTRISAYKFVVHICIKSCYSYH